MKDKTYSNDFSSYIAEIPQGEMYSGNGAIINSRDSLELYDEKKDIPSTVIRVKRTSTAGKGERWRVQRDEEIILVIEGSKLSKGECIFLRSLDGVRFIIDEFKIGCKNLTEFKIRLKKKLIK